MYQQQLQATIAQKDNINFQMMEINKAIEEIEKIKGTKSIYKIVGPILIKSEKAEVTKDLKSRQSAMELQGKTLEKTEQKLKARFEEVSQKLSKVINVDK